MTIFFTRRTYSNWGWAHRSDWIIERSGPDLVMQLWRLRVVFHRKKL